MVCDCSEYCSSPIVSLEDVALRIDAQTMLPAINWAVYPGQHWVVLGRNGSGKSLLLQMLSTERQPSSGKVRYFGQQKEHLNVWNIRTCVGVVNDSLIRRYHPRTTVRETILSGFFGSIGLYQKVSDCQLGKMEQCAAGVGIVSLLDRPVSTLSAGERQKTFVARAMVNEPRLLILDEPCIAMDIASREEFLSFVDALGREGPSLVMVTHHIEEIVPVFSHVLCLKEGRCITQGRKEAIMQSGVLSDVLGYKVELKRGKSRYWQDYRGLAESYKEPA